jgi:hypothetical protein
MANREREERLVRMLARTPHHLGCNGRIVATDELRLLAWCTCRRRWRFEELSLARFMVELSASTRALTEALQRVGVSFQQAAKAASRFARAYRAAMSQEGSNS